MRHKLRRISVRYWLMGLFSIIALFSVISTGVVIKLLLEKRLNQSITNDLAASTAVVQKMVTSTMSISVSSHLRGIAEENINILKGIYARQVLGELNEKEAKELAKKILLSQIVGETGYVYVINSKGVIKVHPNIGMDNRDMSFHWLAKRQMATKNGYIEYDWKNPDEYRERPKALYMSYFKPWDWIVSVSSYREEFVSLAKLDDIRTTVNTFRFGGTGFAFILDAKNQFVIPPEKRQDRSDFQKPEQWQPIHQIMMEQKNGRIQWDWKDDTSNKSVPILIFFHYLPDMKWFVVSVAFMDEIRQPIFLLRQSIALSIACILPVLLPVGFYLGHRITRPINELAGKMNAATTGDPKIRADESSVGELGNIARHFNSYLSRLQTIQEKLHEEIDERLQAESRLKIFAKVFENALEGITITDLEGKILAVNKAFCDITGYSEQEVVGRNPRILKSDRHDAGFYERMWQGIRTKGNWVGEIWNRRKGGQAYPEILSISAIKNRNNQTTHYVAVFHDISEMKSKEAEIIHQAYHDALTGLPNRALALDRLEMAIAHAKRQGDRIALFFLDMDNFKHVNDSLGHSVGDALLQGVGLRLTELLRDEDTVARLGGDEFLVVVDAVKSDREVINLVERLIRGFHRPFQIHTHELFVTMSVGIAFYPEDGGNAEDLIKNADVAMYQSKWHGKNQYQLFTSELSQRALYRMQLEKEFRDALKRREFTVYFQPKIDPSNDSIAGVEALVRWQKPDGVIVSPGEFIPLAEETGLIMPLGEFVLAESCRFIKNTMHDIFPGLCIAVNLSPVQFNQTDVVSRILDILGETGLPPEFLELEITENTMMTELAESIEKLTQLKKQGISIAIDDFGTGYSSLYYLKKLPISTLKIDKSFIDDITTDPVDAQIVETIIMMAEKLGIQTVAEGVETKAQMSLLNRFKCNLIQGFYYAKPMNRSDLTRFFKDKISKSHRNNISSPVA